ncbi:hypothetical protein [Corallococcus exiguus]|uniref:hypothetical protein n=1 Tax=Corallococcus exiguus TaxID=83462 RepID=UPI001C60A441|nr:hypothetical protein [Corallococcus exiguus]
MAATFGGGEVLIRLLVAGAAGMILGLPYRKRPGGVRAHYLVTLGAALFCISGASLMGPRRGRCESSRAWPPALASWARRAS